MPGLAIVALWMFGLAWLQRDTEKETIDLKFSSRLATSPTIAREHIGRMDSINKELSPLLRMTYPSHIENLQSHAESQPLGQPLFTSWLLLFRFLPFDRMKVTLIDIHENGFIESSPMLTMKLWRHERTVFPIEGGCELRDHLQLIPRLPGVGWLVKIFVLFLFRHRHSKLNQMFGSNQTPSSPSDG